MARTASPRLEPQEAALRDEIMRLAATHLPRMQGSRAAMDRRIYAAGLRVVYAELAEVADAGLDRGGLVDELA